jgi:CBS domain containing-hemolysin-like protein
MSFPGSLRPDELLDQTGIEVPEEGPYETVAGFLLNELGRIAVVGDEVKIPAGMLKVVRLDRRRIDRIRFTPNPVAAVPLTSTKGRTS